MEDNFRNINSLGGELLEGINRMNAGQLSIGELESLTEVAREIYERMVILRYKAYDQLVEEAESTGDEGFSDKDRGSLAELVEQVLPEISFKEEVSLEPALSLSIDFSAIEETVVPERIMDEAPVETTKPAGETTSSESSINERLGREEASLADKLSKSPIADLRKAVGLNQKFSFISALFSGDSKAYDTLMESLNAAPDYVEAARIVRDEMKKRAWDSEDHNVLVLQNLIERRFR
jgi:hypothetical protein